MFAPHSEISIFNQQHPTQTKTLLVEACSELDPISQDDDEDWIIQCKIADHRAKPAKTKEYKVQFHPSAWEQNDKEFEKHIVETVQKAIHDSYGSHWQLALPYSEEDVTKVLKELKETKGEVKLSRKTVTVDWLLDPSQSDHLARCAHFLSTLTVSVTSEDKEQIVRVTTAANLEKAWFSVKFRFENEPGLYESSGKNHKLVLIPGIDGSESALVRLVLKRVVYSYDPEHEICPVWFYGEVRSEMNLVCRQKEITRLMKELDQSWEQLDHRSITPSRVISGDEFVDFSRIGVSQAHDLVPVEPKPSSSHRKPTKASEPPCVSSLCPKSILKTPISKVKNSKQIEFLKSTRLTT
ncbi:hypothetical protein L596_010243 [Steinernema carpocapsae]|uniref:Uncharacterized protein n=1 Tax=Steinernema carpocapsae TaxID=34508 RepID=A0A4U5PHR7_STECR|nr:hypothetical protein L596_010243 [Steinernema carpocapsae]